MKRNILTTVLILASTVVMAQESVVVSVGAGVNNTSSSLKTQAQMGNGYDIHGDVFVPFLRKGWDGSVKGSGKFALGIVVSGAYQTTKSLIPDANNVQAAYKLYNGNLDIANAQKGSSLNKGFTGGAGLQADFTLGSVTLSPAISAGYFSFKQDGFVQSSTVMVNGSAQTIVLRESSEVKNTGFIAIPKLKISYPVVSGLSIYAAAAVNIGPDIKTNQSHLVPAGGFNEKNTYEPVQLSSGKMVSESNKVSYQSISLNAGLSWSFGSQARRLRGKVTKPGDGGVLRYVPDSEPAGKSISEKGVATKSRPTKAQALVTGQPIGGIIVKGGKNPGGSLIVAITNDKGELELNGLEAGNYVFTMTPPDQPQGKSISEKGVATKGRVADSQALVAGQPIGGIVVKGGKNPGGNMMITTTNNQGQFSLDLKEAGNYLFIVAAPGPIAKSITEKGMK